MDSNPRNFNPHKLNKDTVQLYYNSTQKIPYNWPVGSQQSLSSICII